ncbi:MAG: hypothetical protein J2O44_03175, partial [Porphyrobacter sp.]|nr:hypothetical protein [Porphyrobacter sp.]
GERSGGEGKEQRTNATAQHGHLPERSTTAIILLPPRASNDSIAAARHRLFPAIRDRFDRPVDDAAPSPEA